MKRRRSRLVPVADGVDTAVDAVPAGRRSAERDEAMVSELNRLLEPGTVRVLLEVSRTRSFSRAAAALGISQPSVSQHIRRIERHVGRSLFKRLRYGVELTADGRAILIYANSVLNLTRKLQKQLEQGNGDLELAVGMSEDFCRTALPSVLRLFILGYPNVRVRILSGTYETLNGAIQDGSIEFAIIRRHDQFQEMEPLFRDQLVWFGSDMLSLPIEDPIPLVLPLPTNPARDTVLDVLRASGRHYVIRFESIGMAGMEMAIGAGLGICAGPACMPLFTAAPLPDRSGLPALPLAEFVIASREPIVSTAGKAFAALLRQAASSDFTSPRRGT